MSNTLAVSAACVVAAANLVATPAIPVAKAFGGAITSHSGAGLYEFTLDDAINAAECLVDVSATGAVADSQCQVEHVSDTVKRIRTLAAAVAADTVAFSVKFTRFPAGH